MTLVIACIFLTDEHYYSSVLRNPCHHCRNTPRTRKMICTQYFSINEIGSSRKIIKLSKVFSVDDALVSDEYKSSSAPIFKYAYIYATSEGDIKIQDATTQHYTRRIKGENNSQVSRTGIGGKWKVLCRRREFNDATQLLNLLTISFKDI